MAVNVPTQDQMCDVDPDAGLPSANVRQLIGTVSGTKNVKTAGNLPVSYSPGGSSWQNVNTNTGGFLYEGQNGPWDVSSETKLLVWSWQHNAPNRIQQGTVASGGMVIRLATGTGTSNYRDYYISGNDTFGGSSQLGPLPTVCDLNNTDTDATGGTYDNTDVQCYGIIQGAGSMVGSNNTWMFVQRAWILDTVKNGTNIVKFTGTSDPDDLITAVLGSSYSTKIGSWVSKLGDAYFFPVAFQIGDTSTATNFDCTGKTILSPPNNQTGDPRFRYTTQATRVYIVLRDNVADDADLTNSTWTWGVASPFDFDVSNNSTITITGAVFTGMGEMTLGSSVAGGATFSLASGSNLVINDADIDGSTVNGDVDLDSATDLTDVTINGDLRITTGADSNLSFSNVTVTGDVYNDSGSNTLTINATNGSNLTAGDPGTGNGQTNILNNVDLTVTVKDTDGVAVGTAQVGIYQISDRLELLNEDTDGSGIATDVFNYSTDTNVEVRVRKASSGATKYKNFSSLGTVGSAGLSVLVTMIEDPNNNATT